MDLDTYINATGYAMEKAKKKLKEMEEAKFSQKIGREMKLADTRVKSLQDKLESTLTMHQVSFSKYFDQIAQSTNAISDKSFVKLETEATQMIVTYNYAKFYEKQRLVSFEKMQNIFKKCQSIAEAEPMQLKIEEGKKQNLLVRIDDDIDSEEYNCEINDFILERTKSEAILIKEKVRDIQKIIVKLEKKINNAKMLEFCAIHQKEEALTDKKEYLIKIQKMQEQQAISKQELQQKCKEIEKVIESKKDIQKNRERSEDIIKTRAERLKKSIEKLRDRHQKFQNIALKQKTENEKFISQFENLCANFKTEKPDEINDKYIQKTLENQSIVNWFNDLTKNIFELKLQKENLQKELVLYISRNNSMLKEMDQVRFDKGEYHEKMLENQILQQRMRSSKLAELLKQKREIVFSVINGMKHLKRRLKVEGDPKQSMYKLEPKTQKQFEIADISFPEIIGICSKISLLVEKRLTYQYQSNEQYFSYRVMVLRSKDKHISSSSLNYPVKCLAYGQGGIENLERIYDDYKKYSQKRDKTNALPMNDHQNGEGSSGEDDDVGTDGDGSFNESENDSQMEEDDDDDKIGDENENSGLEKGSNKDTLALGLGKSITAKLNKILTDHFKTNNQYQGEKKEQAAKNIMESINAEYTKFEAAVRREFLKKLDKIATYPELEGVMKEYKIPNGLLQEVRKNSLGGEGDDMMPFARKMDSALCFIEEVLQDNVYQFENFGHSLDQSEEEINHNLEEERQEQKLKLLYPNKELEHMREKASMRRHVGQQESKESHLQPQKSSKVSSPNSLRMQQEIQSLRLYMQREKIFNAQDFVDPTKKLGSAAHRFGHTTNARDIQTPSYKSLRLTQSSQNFNSQKISSFAKKEIETASPMRTQQETNRTLVTSPGAQGRPQSLRTIMTPTPQAFNISNYGGQRIFGKAFMSNRLKQQQKVRGQSQQSLRDEIKQVVIKFDDKALGKIFTKEKQQLLRKIAN